MNNKNFLQRWWAKAAAVGGTSFSTTNHEMVAKLGKLIGLGAMSNSGKAVTEDTALSITAAWSCMRIISESIGMLPWSIYKRLPNGDAVRDDTHPLAAVLVGSPNQDMTVVEFRETTGMNLVSSGNSYSLIERLGSDVSSLYPIRSSMVMPKKKNANNTRLPIADGQVFYSVNDRGVWVDYPQEKIWHIKGFGPTGTVGLSPIAAAREAMGFALATDDFGSKFFAQGGKPSGIVTVPGFFNEDQRKIARENLQQLLGGLSNAHKFALFEGGMTPTAWGEMSLEDMSFLVLRKFSVLEMCRVFRIPPHMVAEVEKGASFASIEQMSAEFVMFTLLPYLTRYESSVTKWLLPREERATHFMRFNYEALLRADSKARAEFYNSALQNGWMNRNEVRARENLNRVDGLDEYTVQNIYVPADKLGALAEAQASRTSLGGPGAKDSEDPSMVKFLALVERLWGNSKALDEQQTEFMSKVFSSQNALAAKIAAAASPEERKTLFKMLRTAQEVLDNEVFKGNKVVLDALAADKRARTEEIEALRENLARFMKEAGDAMTRELERIRLQKYRVVFDTEGMPIGREPVDG